MTHMVRKQIYIEPRHEELIKRLAGRWGVSEAELIRQAIDQQISSGRLQSVPPDRISWEQAYQFMMDLYAKGPLTGQARDWSRKDLYEGRLSRYDHDSD
jgi:hypothetical protein